LFHLLFDSLNLIVLLQAAAAKGEAPPGLPLKAAGQDSLEAQPKVFDPNALLNFGMSLALNP